MQTLSLQGQTINLNDSFFEETINSLIKDYKLQEIIETGTFNGLGSTLIFAKTGLRTISMESCKAHYEMAKNNLQNYPNVELHYASSLSIKEMEQFIQKDDIYNSDLVVLKKIKVDGLDANNNLNLSKSFYINEIKGFADGPPPVEDLLLQLVDNNNKQLVFLDSAGGVGYLEFKKFLNLKPEKLKNKVLVLDDVSHVKHYRSVVELKQKSYRVEISPDQRFAYCIFSQKI